jgi:hypothetical protein
MTWKGQEINTRDRALDLGGERVHVSTCSGMTRAIMHLLSMSLSLWIIGRLTFYCSPIPDKPVVPVRRPNPGVRGLK